MEESIKMVYDNFCDLIEAVKLNVAKWDESAPISILSIFDTLNLYMGFACPELNTVWIIKMNDFIKTHKTPHKYLMSSIEARIAMAYSLQMHKQKEAG
jgi:hypothetical protein